MLALTSAEYRQRIVVAVALVAEDNVLIAAFRLVLGS
jgi:ABC-type microcin C transport system duplicated ATPase subunit YejF